MPNFYKHPTTGQLVDEAGKLISGADLPSEMSNQEFLVWQEKITPPKDVLAISTTDYRDQIGEGQVKLQTFKENLNKAVEQAQALKVKIDEYAKTEQKEDVYTPEEKTAFDITEPDEDPEVKKAREDAEKWDTQLQNVFTQLDTLSTGNQVALQAQKDAIKAQFDVRRGQMEDLNQRNLQMTQTLGYRLGTARYAPLDYQGIVSFEEQKGIQRLADLDAQELSAIQQAQTAADQKDWDIMMTQIGLTEKIQQQKADTYKELRDKVEERNKEMQDRVQKIKNESIIADLIGQGITDPIEILRKTGISMDEISAVVDNIVKNSYEKDNAALAQDMAQRALDNGQGKLAGDITQLDPKSLTFKDDIARLMSKISDPNIQLDLELKRLQIQKAQNDLMPVDTDTDNATTPEEQAIKQRNYILEGQDKIDNIDALISHPGFNTGVGPNWLARETFLDAFGAKQDFIAGVQQITEQLTLDKLIEAKKSGATFGALSDGERLTLAAAATKIGSWAIKDKNGKVTGYNASEKSFRKELENIKEKAQRDLDLRRGVSEDDYLDNVVNSLNSITEDIYLQAGY